jgi:hypothetical protein
LVRCRSLNSYRHLNMPGEVIKVVLEEGFSGGRVTARVAERVVYDNTSVTTKLLTGMAASFEVDRDEALEHGIVLELPAQGINEAIEVSGETAALRISLTQGALEVQKSTQTPGYM